MKKNFLYILFSSITLIACCISYWLYSVSSSDGKMDYNKYKEYLFLFKDSEIKNLDKLFCMSFVNERDVYTNFNYKHLYFISVWEFKDLKSIDLNSISVNINKNLDNIKFDDTRGYGKDILFEKNIDFKGKMKVDLDEKSIVEKEINGLNYKGFYGLVDRMVFGNGEKDLVLFHSTKKKIPTILVLYKNKNSFYVIKIESDSAIDTSILEIFNLK